MKHTIAIDVEADSLDEMMDLLVVVQNMIRKGFHTADGVNGYGSFSFDVSRKSEGAARKGGKCTQK